jgi:hypothetical protein
VTFQRKSLQLLGDGTAFDDVHVPRSAATPLFDGPSVLSRSNPHAPAAIAKARQVRVFFMSKKDWWSQKYTKPITASLPTTARREPGRHFNFELSRSNSK